VKSSGRSAFTITADDFGLEKAINEGIIYCAQEGLIQRVSLLLNAPGTEEAIEKIPLLKNIEVGLHLGIVEGYSLSGKKSLINDVSYFPGELACLFPSWKEFASHYLTGKIDRSELRQEFEMQILHFIKRIGPIPFINSTQHLHMLPGIFEILLELCEKYSIPQIRCSRIGLSELKFMKQKVLSGLMLNACWPNVFLRIASRQIHSMGKTYGISCSGQINERFVDFIFHESTNEQIELIMHPGYHSQQMKHWLPESYGHFDWEKEIRSLIYLKDKMDQRFN
jgi:predicted glycoside hydrolase/deacetylase ChbG (UPF0249 family)